MARNKFGTLTYARCKELLGSKNSRKVAPNTWIIEVTYNGVRHYHLQLHSTCIILFSPDGRVQYYSGGYQSATTKERLCSFGPCHVCQVKYIWYVGDREFEEGMDVIPGLSASVGLPSGTPLEIVADKLEDEGRMGDARQLRQLI